MESNSTDEATEIGGFENPILAAALITGNAYSIVCTLFILIYFATHWRQMVVKALYNHAILLLTIVSFLYIILDLPFAISLYTHGYEEPRYPSFCLWWYWVDYTLLCGSLFLTATASVQRHILVFNSHLLRIRRWRWLLHYIPLIIFTFYTGIYYFIFMVLYPCETIFDEEDPKCPIRCYALNPTLYLMDWIVNILSPVIIILLANILLFVRVIYSMKNIQLTQERKWKRQKKLSLQLFAFTSLYVIVWTPTTIVSLLGTFFMPNLFMDIPNLSNIYHMILFVCPLQVFIYTFTLEQMNTYIKAKILELIRRTQVMTVTMVRTAQVIPLATVGTAQ